MATANPFWGAPRIHGELLKLGLEVSESSVSRWMPESGKTPSPSWRAFLENHVGDLVSIDFFTVPTARFQVLFCLLILSHKRRRVPPPLRTTRRLIQSAGNGSARGAAL